MTSIQPASKVANKWLLLKETLFQTPSRIAKRLLSPLVHDKHCSLLELGAGAGGATKIAYRLIKHKEKYLGFEIHGDLYQFICEKYREFRFICASAESLSDHTKNLKFDLVVANLPWCGIDDFTRKTIFDQISKHLDKGAYFKTYLSLFSFFTASGRGFRRQLEENFVVHSEWVFLSVPPAKIYECYAPLDTSRKT